VRFEDVVTFSFFCLLFLTTLDVRGLAWRLEQSRF
jgi:hypothetical protein